MKHITLSLLALTAMTMADSNTTTSTIFDTNNMELGVYAGVGFSSANIKNGDHHDYDKDDKDKDHAKGGMLQLGVKVNDYLSIETRYTKVKSDDDSQYAYDSLENIAIYAKPTYGLGDLSEKLSDVKIYGLVGFGQTDIDDTQVESFQFGAGLAYDLKELTGYDMNVFADATSLYRGDEFASITKSDDDDKIMSFNFGVNYAF